MSQLKKGALLSYVTIFLTNIIGLVLTPFIIRTFGNAEYGLYTLIGAFVGYISVMDLGLNNTIVRFVAKYRAEENKEGEENFLAITMIIYAAISIIISIIGVVLYFNLGSIFGNSLTLAEIEKAKVMFIILIFNLAITLPGGAFTAICNGYEHFVYPRLVNIIRYIVRSLLVVGLLLYGGDAIGLVVLDTFMNLLVIAFNGWYVFKKLNIRIKLHRFEMSFFKEIFSYSFWIFVFSLSYNLQWNASQTVLGMNASTVSVAIFGVGILLVGYYAAFAGAVNTILLPKATALTMHNDNSDDYNLNIIQVGRIVIFILLFILSAFYLFGQEFIFLWIGDAYLSSWKIALLLMISLTLLLVHGFGNSILEAKKKNKFKAILSFMTLFFAVTLGYFFSKKYGIEGISYPLSIAIFLNGALMMVYYKKVFGFEIFLFMKSVFFKPVFSTIILVSLYKLILQYFRSNSWSFVAIFGILYFIIYTGINYWVILDKDTKSIIFKFRK